jgi:hypothetical protein
LVVFTFFNGSPSSCLASFRRSIAGRISSPFSNLTIEASREKNHLERKVDAATKIPSPGACCSPTGSGNNYIKSLSFPHKIEKSYLGVDWRPWRKAVTSISAQSHFVPENASSVNWEKIIVTILPESFYNGGGHDRLYYMYRYSVRQKCSKLDTVTNQGPNIQKRE